MDNSVFDMLSKMFMGGFNTNAQNFSQINNQNAQNFSQNNQSLQNNNAFSYYPNEMFVTRDHQNNSQNNETAQNYSPNSSEQFSNQTGGNPFNQNNFMPMLLSLLSGNKNSSLSDVMSFMSGQNKNQSEETQEKSQEKIPPSDEIIL